MSKDEQLLISRDIRTAAFNGLIEDGNVSEEIAHVIADHVEAEFLERSEFLLATIRPRKRRNK